MKFKEGMLAGAAISLSVMSAPSFAQTDDGREPNPFYSGAYVAPMGTWLHTLRGNTDDGWGGALAAGWRQQDWAVELQLGYVVASGDNGGDVDEASAAIYGLFFPFQSLPNFYGIFGGGMLDLHRYPGSVNNTSFGSMMFAGGLGHLWHFGGERYDWGLRTEVLYRHAETAKTANERDGVPKTLGDIVVNVGLYLPLGYKKAAAEPTEPVAVVPAGPVDSDGDGVPDDQDRCPDTPAGTQVDAQGCPLPPPCKPPEAGQLADFSGCAVGDSIVLHGVNFEFDKARLTVNAKAILDMVVGALQAAPAVQVEIGGHTDSRGSDSYNQRLSEERAHSVMAYLAEQGIDAARLTAKGYGETQPVADNDTDEGRELNRRVELKIVAAHDAAAPAAAEAVTEAASETAEAVHDAAHEAAAEATEAAEEAVESDDAN